MSTILEQGAPPTAQLSRITVRSGAQTGADFGFIHGAKMMGATTAGWIPRGWLTEEGPMPWLKEFGLVETPEANYNQRTSWNVRDAEVTILFGDPGSRGSTLTIQCAELHAKPILRIPWDPSKPTDPSEQRVAAIVAWLKKHGATHINGAGNRESVAPGITVASDRLIRAVLSRLSTNDAPAPSRPARALTSCAACSLWFGRCQATSAEAQAFAAGLRIVDRLAPTAHAGSCPGFVAARKSTSRTTTPVYSEKL